MTDSPVLTKGNADPDPINQFKIWYDEVLAKETPDANAMTLATATKDARPSARIVLLKSFDDQGFVFYTNYLSRKAKEIDDNPQASLLFYWSAFWRQVRVEGPVEKISLAESEEYFQSRPLGSKLGAWASNQSDVVANRESLEARFAELEKRFGTEVPRPEHWGGYRLIPSSIEFWQGRDNRLHDRLRYRLENNGSWVIERLAP
jgi:pyridoxamine 5'-phosphate oxidase